jgi:hypothetical protein
VEIMILCLRPLPAANGGWNSAKWRTPKLAAPVSVRPVPLAEWLAALAAPMRTELQAILSAPFVAALRLEAPATAFETAIAYAGVVAEACAGVIILGEELTADRRASVTVWSGPQIEERWRAIDAEAARAEPGYLPVRDVNDDHRPTQSFAFPIVIDGLEITTPTTRAVYEAALGAMAAAEEPADVAPADAVPAEAAPTERHATGSTPPPTAAAPDRRITVAIPPLASAAPEPPRGKGGAAASSPAPLDDADHEKTYDSAAAPEDDWSDVMPD